MILKIKQTFIAAVLASATTFATGSAAQAECGLECWLSNTFSSRDWVGDWLKDTFEPVMNSAGQDGGRADFQDFEIANKIVSEWPPAEKLFGKEEFAKLRPACKLPKLLAVVNKERSPEALIKLCFK